MANKKPEPMANLTGNNLFIQDDFTGGQNESVSDTLLQTNESPEVKNIDLDRYGVLKPRKGTKQVFSSDFSSNGVTGLHGYYKSTGLKQLVFSVDDKVLASNLKTDVEYTTQAEFETGTVGTYVSTSDTPDSMVIVPTDTDFTIEHDYDLQADFETGELINIDTTTTPDSILLTSDADDFSYVEDTQAEFSTGELDGLVAVASGKLRLQVTGTTWSDYSSNDWSEM